MAGAVDDFTGGQTDRPVALGDQPVGRGAVQVDGEQGGFGRPVLGEQGDDQAAQHIAHAGRRHARGCPVVDPPAAVGQRNDRAAAFQCNVAAIAVS